MINNQLYRALLRLFRDVRVVREDVAMSSYYEQQMHDDGPKMRLRRIGSGEEFQINCPFCGDTRRRLTINHRWGVYDPRSNTRNLWLAQCYNQQCLSEYDNQRTLYDRVYSYASVNLHQLPSGRQELNRIRYRIRDAGATWRVDDMYSRQRHHAAIRYLLERMLDPVELGRDYGVGYLLEPRLRELRSRLYVPMMMHGKFAGWQARVVGAVPDKFTPKWYTCPGMQKSMILYNFDRARHYPTKVLVEGPADVWATGPYSMAVLGKTVSEQQILLLEQVTIPGDLVVVLFDPDQALEEKAKRKLHHIDVAVQRLRGRSRLVDRVLPVYLPSGTDPGSLDRDFLQRLIRKEAAAAGLDASFEPRTNNDSLVSDFVPGNAPPRRRFSLART